MSLALSLDGSARAAGVPLFPDIAFRAVAGGWTCLLGPSGVGKSTLLRLLAGLPTGVEFSGRIAASDGGAVGKRAAWMAQDDLLLPWLDVAGNIGVGARLRGTRADPSRVADLAARVGLAEHIRKRPAQLSGGQRQRVALARTLIEDRPFVLLDEPFSALDARTRTEMQELAFEMLAGRTVVLVTHDPAEAARLASRICLMGRDGLSEMDLPAAPAIRAVEDADMLAHGARMLAVMRGLPA